MQQWKPPTFDPRWFSPISDEFQSREGSGFGKPEIWSGPESEFPSTPFGS
jgi:hypothetical protein